MEMSSIGIFGMHADGRLVGWRLNQSSWQRLGLHSNPLKQALAATALVLGGLVPSHIGFNEARQAATQVFACIEPATIGLACIDCA
jgi:hypothetical protein